MPYPCVVRFQTSLMRLAVFSCALWGAAAFHSGPTFAQATKPPTMGSAGATGGSVPSSPPNRDAAKTVTPGADPATPLPSETQPPPVKPVPRPAVREVQPSSPAPSLRVDSGIPAFHLARLEMEGEVTGDRAIITAQIDVDVNRDDRLGDGQGEAHDVPLRLTQAHVLSKEYTGPGREGPVVDRPVEDGIVWRFMGFGTHHLKLKMWVPVRQSPAGRQLILSLPTMPPGFDAQLNLSIPGPLIVIRGSNDLSVLSNERVGELNRISADVRGPRLDMTWSEPPDVQTSFLQATTSVTLRREGDRVIATAEQVLVPENVGVKEAEIKLPDGFDLDEVTGPLVKGHEAVVGRSGVQKIRFRETSGERVDLNWILSAPFPANGGTLQFDGLVVQDARSQAGRIQLQDFPGYQMVPRPGQFVRRAAPNSPNTVEAFEFTKQPFRIAWDVQRVASKFSVRPRHLLFIGTTQMVLESRFRIQTDSGSLDQVELGWDSAMAEGWRLDPASVTGQAVVPTNGDQLSQNGRLQVSWTTPQSGSFEVSLRFIRPVSSGMQSARVSLPRLRGSRSQSADLLVAAEDQLEVKLSSVSGVELPSSVADLRRLEGVAAALVSQIQRAVSLDPDQFQVDLSWKTQTRIVEADAELELRRATDGRVRVQQTVRFQSRYGRLSAVRFQLPKSLAAMIPAGAAGSAIGLTIDGQAMKPVIRDGIVEAQLSEPRLGEILATLEYSIPLTTNSPQSTVVPVLMSLDAKFPSIRVRIPEGEPLRVPPTAEGWQPVPTSPNATVWVTTTSMQVPVVLDADLTTSPRFSVDQAFYRTRYDNAGQIEGVCELHWAGDVRGLPVNLPPDTEFLGAMYNGRKLDPTQGQVVSDPANPSQIQFRFPPAPDGSRLALWYRSNQASGFSHRDLRTVQLPQLPKDVSVVRSTWELELPAGRHLFIGPADLTPEHQWRRSGLLWFRTPTTRYVAEREAATVEARLLTTVSSSDQVYAFSSIGPIEAPRFQSMTRSLILMLGAGLTLALGFLFWSLPVTRNMLTLLLIAFGVSLLSLWFLEPIQLLLQPAALGAVLAILASLIDLKSRQPSMTAFPASVLPIPLSTPGSHPSEAAAATAGRGSSVSRHRSPPLTPTAIYQPDQSEVGSS